MSQQADEVYAGVVPLPIETAPLVGEILLFRPGKGWDVGHWDDQKYNRQPRPFWGSSSKSSQGTAWARGAVPTHWLPLPPDPK